MPAVELAPPVKMASTTCRSRTTSAARVRLHQDTDEWSGLLRTTGVFKLVVYLGCQCDVGGSVGQSCGERNGRCHCRPNVEGPKCNL